MTANLDLFIIMLTNIINLHKNKVYYNQLQWFVIGSELTDGHDIDPTLTAGNSVSGGDARKVRVARAVNDASSKRRGQGEGQEGACCACGIAKYQLIFESLWPGSGSQHNDLPNSEQ